MADQALKLAEQALASGVEIVLMCALFLFRRAYVLTERLLSAEIGRVILSLVSAVRSSHHVGLIN